MVLEKQLGNGCTWIETSAPTWITTVKVGRLPLSIMS